MKILNYTISGYRSENMQNRGVGFPSTQRYLGSFTINFLAATCFRRTTTGPLSVELISIVYLFLPEDGRTTETYNG
jgi:hypothetical protein